MSSDDWKAKFEELQEKYDDYFETSEALEEEQAQEIAESEKRESALRVEVATLRDQLESSLARESKNNKESTTLQQELEQVKKLLEEERELRRKLEQSNDELESKLRIESATVQANMERLEQAMEQSVLLETEREEIRESTNATIQRQKEEISELKGDIVAMQVSRSRMESGNGEASSGEHLLEEIEQLKQKLLELNEELAEEQQQCDDLSNQVSDMTDEMIESHAKTTKLENELKASELSKNELMAELEQIQSVLKNSQTELETIQKDKLDVIASCDTLRAELAILKESSGAESSELVAKLKSAEQDKLEAIAARVSLEAELVALKESSGAESSAVASKLQEFENREREFVTSLEETEKDKQEAIGARNILQAELIALKESSEAESCEFASKLKEMEDKERELVVKLESAEQDKQKAITNRESLEAALSNLKESSGAESSELVAKIQSAEKDKQEAIATRESLEAELIALKESSEAESSDLVEKLKGLENNERELVVQLENAEKDKQEALDALDSLQAEMTSLKESSGAESSAIASKLQELENSKRELVEKLERAEDDKQEAIATHDTLQAELVALKESSGVESSELATKLSRIEDEKLELVSELEHIQQLLTGKESDLKISKEEALEAIEIRDSLQAELAVLKESQSAVSSDLAAKLEELEESNHKIDTELEQAKKEKLDLAASYDLLQAELTALKEVAGTESHELSSKLEQVENSKDEIAAELERAETEKRDALASLTSLQSEVAKLQDSLNLSQTELEKKSSDADSLSSKVEELTLELSQVKEEREELTKNMESASTSLEVAEANMTKMESQKAELQALQSQLEELEGELNVRDEENKELHEKFSQMENEQESLHEKLAAESERREQVANELASLKNSSASTAHELSLKSDQVDSLSAALDSLRLEKEALAADVGPRVTLDGSMSTSEELKALRIAYAAQLRTNAEILARMQTIGGNVMVCCRVRPFTESELTSGGTAGVVKAVGAAEIAFYNERKKEWRPFAFDRVFGPKMVQRQVTNEIADLRIAESVLSGTSCCVMAYGQTGSGKTFTMDGPEESPGANRVLIEQVFRLAGLLEASGEGEYRIRMAMVEIYNDNVHDLLGASPVSAQSKTSVARTRLKVGAAGASEMSGLTWEECKSSDAVRQTLATGRSNRATAFTNLNEHSSRSHLIVMVEVQGIRKASVDDETGAQDEASVDGSPEAVEGTMSTGILYLVDLAGSERVAKSEVTGERLDETKHINKSLSALGDVMEALDKKSRHVPYRNSKLTHVLKQALSPASRLLMILTVPPTASAASETYNSLRFAQRARSINLGPATQRVEALNSNSAQRSMREDLRQARATVSRLGAALATAKKAAESAELKVNQMAALESRTGEAHARSLERLNASVSKELNDLRLKHVSMKQAHKDDSALAASELNRARAEYKVLKQRLEESTRLCTDAQRKLEVQQREISRLRSAISASELNGRTSTGAVKRLSARHSRTGSEEATTPVRGGYDAETDSAARKRRPVMATPAAKVFEQEESGRNFSHENQSRSPSDDDNGTTPRKRSFGKGAEHSAVHQQTRKTSRLPARRQLPPRNTRAASRRLTSGTLSDAEDVEDDNRSVASTMSSATVGAATSRYALRSTRSRIARIGSRVSTSQNTQSDAASVTSTTSVDRFLAPTISSRSKLRRPGFSKD